MSNKADYNDDWEREKPLKFLPIIGFQFFSALHRSCTRDSSRYYNDDADDSAYETVFSFTCVHCFTNYLKFLFDSLPITSKGYFS